MESPSTNATATATDNSVTTTATASTTPAAAAGDPSGDSASTTTATALPVNRFELELEFVQALASPAYIHFLATSRVDDAGTSGGDGGLLLQDTDFQKYLQYLYTTWTDPAYSKFLSYPHSLYFLKLLTEKPALQAKEWTLPAFRNFCHQQQFSSWQHRHETLYGGGSSVAGTTASETATDVEGQPNDAKSPT
jgi:mediator of RNA polymerase II transcription subunit 31